MKKTIKPYCWRLFVIIVLCVMYLPAQCQQQVQIVTKTITKTLSYTPGDTLKILAEKANVNITTWSGNEVSVIIRLISKHKKKEIAESELQYLNYEIRSEKGVHTLSNFFATDGTFKSVKGVLTCSYELKIPQSMAVDLSNRYGMVSISGLSAKLKATIQFVELQLTECIGEQEIQAFFGEVTTSDGGGTLSLNLQKTDVELVDFKGKARVKASYGKVGVSGDEVRSFSLIGERTAVSLLFSNPKAYNYDLKTTFSKIKLPDMLDFEAQSANEFKKEFSQGNPNIRINTTYSPIQLNTYYNVSNH